MAKAKPHGILKWTTPYKTSKCQITVVVIKYIIRYVYIVSGFTAIINIEQVELFIFKEYVKENNIFNFIHFLI